jgi:3-oxoacyl-[acyl-carrier protein] reductase
VLVVGASGDLGRAIAARYVAGGHRVTGTSRAELDLSSAGSIDAFVAGARPRFGVLVHAAGRNFPAPLAELSDEEIRACFEVNVGGFVRLVRALADELGAAQGRIVVLSSIFGVVSRRGRLAYAMSKHALVGAVRTLALELGPKGVLVNSVSPGYISTRLTAQNNDPATIAALEAAVPLGRMGRPEEVAEAVYVLGSSANG